MIPANIEAAREERHVKAMLADALTDPVRWGDLVVCTETLEHLIDPHGFLAECPGRVIVASSPDGETTEHHYEFHTYGWDLEGYRTMFETAGYDVLRHESMGFQVLLGVRR